MQVHFHKKQKTADRQFFYFKKRKANKNVGINRPQRSAGQAIAEAQRACPTAFRGEAFPLFFSPYATP